MIQDHESRSRLMERYKQQWNGKLAGLPEHLLETVKAMEAVENHSAVQMDVPQEVLRYLERENMLPSAMMQEYYGALLCLYVPEDKRAQYLALIDKLNLFPAYGGRGSSYAPFAGRIFELLTDYKILAFYGGNLANYLTKDMPEELADIRTHTNLYAVRYVDDLVAAAIDAGDAAVIRIAEEMLSGGECAVDAEDKLLSGILKSSDRSLQEAVCRTLAAAGTQDGVRELICRAADSGAAAAFTMVFDCICENRLFRFGSVRMRLMSWFHVWDSKGIDLLTGDYLPCVQEALHHRDRAVEYCGSSDCLLIAIGLWATGIYDMDRAIEILRQFQREGTKPQLLAMAYYIRERWSDTTCRRVAQRVLHDGRNQHDLEITAAYWDVYCLDAGRYLRKAGIRGWGGPADDVEVRLGDYFENREEAERRVGFMRGLLQRMPGKEARFAPCIFPWHSAKITASGVLKQLSIHARLLGDAELAEYVLDRIQEIKKEADSGSRADYVELLLYDTAEPKYIDRLVSLVADRESGTQETAARLLQDVPLEERHYAMLEEFLRLKNGGIRRHAIGLLCGQDGEQMARCIERLMQSGDQRMREGALELQQILEAESGDDTGGEQEGYGLYRTDAHMIFPQRVADRQAVVSYFTVEKETVDGILTKLARVLDHYMDQVYVSEKGRQIQLSYYLDTGRWQYDEEVPFPEVWRGFYDTEIQDARLLTLLALCLCDCDVTVTEREICERWNRAIYGNTVADYVLPERIRPMGHALARMLEILTDLYGQEELCRTGLEALQWILEDMPPEEMWYHQAYNGHSFAHQTAFLESGKMHMIRRAIDSCGRKGQFADRFFLYAQLDEKYRLQQSRGRQYRRYTANADLLDLPDYVKACSLGLIGEEILYRNIFERWGLSYAFEMLGLFVDGAGDRQPDRELQKFMGGTAEEGESFLAAGRRIYIRLTERILDAELTRGELPTVFSESIGSIGRIYGLRYFVQILRALGDEKFTRSGRESVGKTECLSHLLSVCEPQAGESATQLRALLEENHAGKAAVSDRRLVEAGMFAPQWLDILEEYLGIEGQKSGAYYFIAHMDDRFDDRRRAAIACYTPLTTEELKAGAFDCGWFRQVYAALGEKHFARLYDAAKYISDGAKHVRARKYADAALGKVSVEKLEAEITAKRNKDLLMSYGLVPFRDRQDMLHRYRFIEQFLTESRNFGHMRRASEAEAVRMALRNMATAAGYADTMRLTLAMEYETAGEYAAYHKRKEQSRRCVRMFERAMTERETFCHEELAQLCENPVAGPVVRALVFVVAGQDQDGGNGYYTRDGLVDAAGGLLPLRPDAVLRVAHPVDLYQAGVLETYQRNCSDQMDDGAIRQQPFQQLFRKFYGKMEEEQEQTYSCMHAGCQMEPRQAFMCLSGRGWIIDVESGIQKVCYGSNIVAQIIVLSGWIMEEDLLTPSIERIEFYDRMSHKAVRVRDVPDIVYSEIMRDVALAETAQFAQNN